MSGLPRPSSLLAVLLLVLLTTPRAHAQVFTKIVGDPLTSDRRYSEGAAWGDVNRDGYLDVFVPHLHADLPNALLINNGDGTFSEAATDPVSTDDARSSGGVFGDFDNDGDLDLFVSNYYNLNNALYLNTGDGTFERVVEGDVVNDGGFSFGATVVDYDSDGDPDVFVANGASRSPSDVGSALYRNEGGGRFTEVDLPRIGVAHSYASYGSWADYDNDGDFDLYVTNFLGNNNDLYQNDGDGTFTRVTTGIVVQDGGDSVSSSWGDYDNDGDLDLYVTNDFNENNHLYENRGDGTFAKVTVGAPVQDGGRSNGATWADYNNDGYLDLFVPNGQQGTTQSNNLYRNDGPFTNGWISITGIATTSNTTAIGTSLRVKTTVDGEATWQRRYIAGGTGFNAQNSLPAEFGLGRAAAVDSLIIMWPSGVEEVYVDVEPGRLYVATEGEGLSTHRSTARHALPLGGAALKVHPAFPNPFGTVTTLTMVVRVAQAVEVSIYNVLGQKLKTLTAGMHNAGTHHLQWDGRDDAGRQVVNGVYISRMQGKRYARVQALTLVR